MKILLILLFPVYAFAQLPAGKYLKVKDDASGFELITLSAVPGARLADSTAAIREWTTSNYAFASHTHTGVYQPVLSGTGFIKASGTTISYDNSTYLTTALAASTYQSVLGFTPVANTVTVNGHALSGNITVTASDLSLGNVDNTSDATKNAASVTLTNKTISGASNTISNIPQSAITNYAGYTIAVQALTSSPTDAQTIYFGNLPKAPVTAAATSKMYIRQAGTITGAELYCYSGTAGTNESWSIYIRVNNTTDYLIATVAANTSERVFSNTGLSISVSSGDYIEIKSVNPTWATNPLTTIFGGYIRIN